MNADCGLRIAERRFTTGTQSRRRATAAMATARAQRTTLDAGGKTDYAIPAWGSQGELPVAGEYAAGGSWATPRLAVLCVWSSLRLSENARVGVLRGFAYRKTSFSWGDGGRWAGGAHCETNRMSCNTFTRQVLRQGTAQMSPFGSQRPIRDTSAHYAHARGPGAIFPPTPLARTRPAAPSRAPASSCAPSCGARARRSLRWRCPGARGPCRGRTASGRAVLALSSAHRP